MSIKGSWASNNPYSKFMLLVGVVLISACLMTGLSMFFIEPIYGIKMTSLGLNPDYSNPTTISALKFLQIVQVAGFFIIPSVLIAILISYKPWSFLGVSHTSRFKMYVLAAVAMLVAVPLINWLGILNQHLSLPASFAGVENWMKEMEQKAAEVTKAFLVMKSVSDLVVNIIIVALLAALGEELLFRGVIQNIFKEWLPNIHVAIILAALLFSAMHMQFYGFLPRFLMGVFLGYLFVWSGSIWVPITAHFVNNAAAVLFEYYNQRSSTPLPVDVIGTRTEDTVSLIISIVMFSGAAYLLYRNRTGGETDLA